MVNAHGVIDLGLRATPACGDGACVEGAINLELPREISSTLRAVSERRRIAKVVAGG